MFLITTRSSRFFVVLLHLVGVSTHLPASFKAGIVGVNPFSIVLERLDPTSLLEDQRLQQESQPHWLQDSLDGTCLGPMGGFSDCGDATLWLIVPRQRKDGRRRQLFRWATEEDDDDEYGSSGYALQVVEDDSYLRQPAAATGSSGSDSSFSSSKNGAARSSSKDYQKKECLTRRRKDNKLILSPCSKDQVWSWQVNEEGILYFDHQASSSSFSSRGRKSSKQPRLKKQKQLDCVWRNSSMAVLSECDGQAPPVGTTRNDEERVVQFALVRQAAMSSTSAIGTAGHDRIRHQPSLRPATSRNRSMKDDARGAPSSSSDTGSEEEEVHLPQLKDIAHSHASEPTKHSAPKHGSRLVFAAAQKSSGEGDNKKPPLQFLKNTNPILLASGRVLDEEKNDAATAKAPSLSPTLKPSLLDSTLSSSPVIGSVKPAMKIQLHPYIEAAKNEIWTDSQTGLEYRTDICRWLGHDRKESGRHTLTGVGQYMRTVFNIKVYGVAFYVSKRDVLADPVMEPYARMSSEELRDSSDFFSVLRHMAPSSSGDNPTAGHFDRTLLLKINMQLSTETMRSSLEADWKMLTPEAKNLLITSSLKPRGASEEMLNVIQDPENPSRCSCAQHAPEEYEADPSCCARGTEMSFTWRKNGDIEIRINGVLMDTFQRPDIAEGIFFEYLRLDDPMSFDFLDRVVDGFPFLLAPLAQVKGVSTPVRAKHEVGSKISPLSGSHPVFKAVAGLSESVSSHAMDFAGFVQNGANEMSNHAMNTARSVGDAARNLGEEMDRRRDILGKQFNSMAHQALSSLYGRDQKALTVVLPNWVGEMSKLNMGDESLYADDNLANSPPRGRVFRIPLARLFGIEELPPAPDEIVPMIHQASHTSTHRIFLGLVHLYLLLLLIVSFPAHRTTVTKLYIRKSGFQDLESSDSESSLEANSPPLKHFDLSIPRDGAVGPDLTSTPPRTFRSLKTALHSRLNNPRRNN